MKIASFNVENLFERARIFNEKQDLSNEINGQVTELNNLLESEVYSDQEKERILELIIALGLENSDESRYVLLRQNRGKLISRPHNGPVELVANGRSDWIGWLELKNEPVNEQAILHTAMVIRDVNPDVLAVIEAENRIALKQYSDILLKKVNGIPFDQIMLIDGNDTRGIDVGLLAKTGYHIQWMLSHVHDVDENGKLIFSRDCPEYCVQCPNGEIIWILPNHFKSKFGGNDTSSQSKRKKQAQRVAEIYHRMTAEGKENIVVLGDLNDTPDSLALKPLLEDTDLMDVSTHHLFDTGEFDGMGTFGLGNDNQKIDYILLSPKLYDRIQSCGIFRKGAWPGSSPVRWEVYPTLREPIHVASDHHLIWVELDV